MEGLGPAECRHHQGASARRRESIATERHGENIDVCTKELDHTCICRLQNFTRSVPDFYTALAMREAIAPCLGLLLLWTTVLLEVWQLCLHTPGDRNTREK